MLLGGFAKAVPCSYCAANGVLCMKVVGKAIKPFRASFLPFSFNDVASIDQKIQMKA